VSRSELRDYCRGIDQSWVDDPTNQDMRYDRSKYRAALASLNAHGLQTAAIAASARHLAEARSALSMALHDRAKAVAQSVDGAILLDADGFFDMPPEFQRRLAQSALQWVSRAEYGPRGGSLTAAIAALSAGKTTTLAGCMITRARGTISVSRELGAVTGTQVAPHQVWDRRWQITGPKPPAGAVIAALGEAGLIQCTNWRETGRPRATLLVSPALWARNRLISAPLAEITPKWQAKISENVEDFFTSLLSR